ncbi:SDR family oxidoreductase [Spirillospora sp. CA-255316]
MLIGHQHPWRKEAHSMDLNGAVVLVTGASSGIGAATARAASLAGARVVLAARREERIRRLADELGEAVSVRCDVTDSVQVEAAVRTATDAFGRIDVLVNNAGQGLHAPIDKIDPEDFRAIVDLNLVAPLVTMRAVIPVMREQSAGSIINVSSGITLSVIPGSGAYAGSKAGLNMLSAVARAELASAGIAVSTMYPFITATEFSESIRADRVAASRLESSHAPQPHAPEQVAAAILDLIRTGAERADLVPERFGGSYKG